MRKLTGFAIAGVVSMLASTVTNAIPLWDGAFTLDSSSTMDPVEIIEFNADGFDNLSLAFSAIGGGSIDPCDGRYNQDCLSVLTDEIDVTSGLSITRDWQDYGPFELAVADSSFDMIFSARITGADENMTINWQLSGEEIQLSPVPEPGTMALLGLGLIGFGITRRRSS